MANVKKWSYSFMKITWGKGFMEDIYVDTAVLDSDVQCMHCGKNIKIGKFAFCGSRHIPPSNYGDSSWGGGSHRPTFCSSSHAKAFAKNNKGI